MPPERIRNFSIIAHIDHGKSTLADRILELTGAVSKREMRAQYLDSMDLERERGITIKATPVRLEYKAKDGQIYRMNLIDTPGHVDFSYEVSRSLACCEGAVLVVDVSQGVEAQTLAHANIAMELGLGLLPVLNKIDLKNADPERACREIEELLGLDTADHVRCSAKEGVGIQDVLESVIRLIPPPKGDRSVPLRALLFDSWFDDFRGVIVVVRVFEGHITPGKTILFMSNQKTYLVEEVGIFAPKPVKADRLDAGDVGYIIAGIREVRDTRVGDTVTEKERPASVPFPGFKALKPMVYAGLYPVDSNDYEDLRDAVEKLRLNDSSFTYEPENSVALGFGFRCGFLGLLHMDVVRERLEREFGLSAEGSLICTAPTPLFEVMKTDGEILRVDNPKKMPDESQIELVQEPIVLATIHVPTPYVGAVLQLCESVRGVQKELKYPTPDRAMVLYDLPLNEIMADFFDRLKSVSKGYASLDYEFKEFQEAEMVKVDMLLNGEPVDALSFIVHKRRAYDEGRDIAERLRKLIPRQQYEVAIQAAIGGKIIARENVKPFRKDVTAKLYGGDITRKMKVLKKQKEGKKRMKMVGRVEVPQEAFLALLRKGQA
ncbi:MAG: elongation factor 4 [Nitrospirae bacterium]|nr:elongation factor 4 [Nitrospirota bacterium]